MKSMVGSVMDSKQIIQSNIDQGESFKKCLQKLSINPRYQYFLVGFIGVTWMLVTFCVMISSFVFMNPLFQCNGESKTQKQACENISQCIITNDFTAVIGMGLYCDKQQIRSTIQSFYAIGCVIGTFFLTLLSDWIGRRKSSILSFFVGVLGISIILIGIKFNSQILASIGMSFAGFFASGFTQLSIIMTCDFCTDKLRHYSIMFYCAMWSVGEIFFYFIYNYFPQWDKYLIYTLLIPIAVLLILMLFTFIQSPVYAIFVNKNPQQYTKIIKQFSFFNKFKKQQQQQIIKQGLQIIKRVKKQGNNEVPLKQSLRKIINNKSHTKIIVCLFLPGFAYNFYYYGIQGSMERTGYNFGFNMLLIGIHQLLAYISASYFTKYIRRKVGIIVSIVILTVAGLMFLIPWVQQQQIVQSILVSISRVAAVYSYSFLVFLSAESIHVEIRSTAYALADGVGQTGRILIPYFINWMNNLGISILIVSSMIFLVFGTLPILGLKQTLVKNLSKQNKNQQYNKFIDQIQQSNSNISNK